MTTIRQLLDEKGSEVWAIDPDDSVFNAVTEMADKDVGGLLVMSGDDIVGIITERDYVRKIILKGRASRETRVSEVMTTSLLILAPDASLSEAADLISQGSLRHIPIVQGGLLAGIISDRDIRKAIGRNMAEETELRELMTTCTLWVEPDSPLSVASVFFSEGKIGALPVLNEGRLLGIFTLTDLLEHCLPVFDPSTDAKISS